MRKHRRPLRDEVPCGHSDVTPGAIITNTTDLHEQDLVHPERGRYRLEPFRLVAAPAEAEDLALDVELQTESANIVAEHL